MKRKNKKPENVPKLKLQTVPCMLCRLCQGEHSEAIVENAQRHCRDGFVQDTAQEIMDYADRIWTQMCSIS